MISEAAISDTELERQARDCSGGRVACMISRVAAGTAAS